MLGNPESWTTFSEALDWLYAKQRFGVQPGLERITALLARLGHPERQFRSVLVGGTNGKGSVSASLAACLQAAGFCTGLFTSPHLTHFGERFWVAGKPVAEAQLLAALQEVYPHAEALEATFFEIVTAVGCLIFAHAGVEWAVMEVGLGGRLDATNALTPELSILTTLGLDHTEVLGDTREAIASEKAGILRSNSPAVTGFTRDYWPVLERTGADLWALGREFAVEVQALDLVGTRFKLHVDNGLGAEYTFQTPLLGVHGAANAALAAIAALRLGLSANSIEQGLTQTCWAGRLEHIRALGMGWLLDGAHNPDGAQALAAALKDLGLRSVRMVFGVSEDKAVSEMVPILAPLVGDVILTAAQWSPRAAVPANLRGVWEAVGVPVRETKTPTEAVALAGQVGGDDSVTVVVCGSLYLVGEVRGLLLREPEEGRERWQ